MGPDVFIDECTERDEAVRAHFPGWKTSYLFPFIIPEGDWGMVDHTNRQIGDFYPLDAVRGWNTPDEPDATFRESFLVPLGLFTLAGDRSGARFCIDTRSSSGLEVAMVDYMSLMEGMPRILEDELAIRSYVRRFKQPLVDLLRAVYVGELEFRLHF